MIAIFEFLGTARSIETAVPTWDSEHLRYEAQARSHLTMVKIAHPIKVTRVTQPVARDSLSMRPHEVYQLQSPTPRLRRPYQLKPP